MSASFVFLIQRLVSSRSAAGISLKTQEMYLLVFMTRYLDVFSNNEVRIFGLDEATVLGVERCNRLYDAKETPLEHFI